METLFFAALVLMIAVTFSEQGRPRSLGAARLR